MSNYSKGPLDSDTDDEVVKDKPIMPTTTTEKQGIRIKGLAKADEENKKRTRNLLKQAIGDYINSIRRILLHEEIRKSKLNIIMPLIKKDLKIIQRKYEKDEELYIKTKEKYIKQFSDNPGEAKAFMKKHLQNL
ncbi:hypothetical protein V8B55DRAFT_1410689 [Mucor lusitanicus]|uniref:Uncharacterized protein n=2 Tax=Mucor circinelloides f. lusitanicus TaxID=29924 RepID=A0A168HR17_MUCCL|nr:hypothetical protein FB192DRAFT_1452095 [Mucor lusitanicus]OAC99078.1 hypothetical protein MUCCIDRAFT_166530 [Mucor lusitanicus CBS 277.49]